MTLPAGSRLGAYEVIDALGQGGMGVVYRARDTRLNRDVAIKVLSERIAQDPAALARFEREAQAVAALSHPNILAIFELAHDRDTAYAVTELLEGQSLRDRLAEGALPVRKAVEIGTAIARGLAAAHERGIVHRDLKPENVFVTTDGVVKILDFGLAKAAAPGQDATAAAAAETRAALTGEGTIVGTVGYMAPEQVRGQPVDARTDLFALGAVLYEMLTGDRAFARASSADTMSAVLREDPPEFPAARSIPPALDRIVHHCLEKTPADRFQTARDVAFALESLAGASSSGTRAAEAALAAESAAPATRGARTRERLLWTGATLALAALAAWLVFTRPASAPPSPGVVRLSVPLPNGFVFRDGFAPVARMAVSPDGRRIAFVAWPRAAQETSRLFIHSLETGTSVEVPGSASALGPFWSPDGSRLSFHTDTGMMVVDIAGGPPRQVSGLTRGPARWSTRGHLAIVDNTPDGPPSRLRLYSSSGDEIESVAAPAGTRFAGGPVNWLPDGQHFLVTVIDDANGQSRVMRGGVGRPDLEPAFDLDLDRDSANFGYADGWFVGVRDGVLVARRARGDGVPGGEPTVLSDAVVGIPRAASAFTVSPTVLAYQPVRSVDTTRLVWFDRKGAQLSQLSDGVLYSNLDLSPDGQQLLVAARQPGAPTTGIWAVDLRRGSRVRVTTDPSVDTRSAVWTADGGGIAHRGADGDIFTRPLGAGQSTPLVVDGISKDPLPFSHDGRILVFRKSGPTTFNDIWVKPMPEGEPRAFIATPANETDASLSPDGRWMAWASTESGRSEIYVTAFPSGAGKWAISTGGGMRPVWRRDGSELFFLDTDRNMMAATVRTKGAAFDWDPPVRLFETDAAQGPGSQFVVSPDGQRFLVNSNVASAERETISVVVGWQGLVQ